MSDPAEKPHAWTFLTNHAHVLILIAADPEIKLRDAAVRVGITERAVQRIVADLEAAGVLMRSREGRRNRYTVLPKQPLRHPVESHRTVADLLALINGPSENSRRVSSRSADSGDLRRRGS